MNCNVAACQKPPKKRGWCTGHYRRWLRYGDPLLGGEMRHRGSLEERIWPRVEKGDDCWRWTGASINTGYGILTTTTSGKKVTHLVHRLVWELTNQQTIPVGFVVMHSCDNRICVRPDHLSVGTQSQNIRDCYARGRR